MAGTSDLQQAVEDYLAAPTPRHRAAAVQAGLPLIHSLIGRMHVPNHPLVTREDLEGTAIEALLQALDSYDPERGTQFVTHAYRRVRGSLVDYLRSLDVLSRDKRQRLNEVYRAMETLRQALHDEPTDRDVADFMGLPLNDYHNLLAEAQLRFTLSLDQPMGDDDGNTLSDIIEDEDGEHGFDVVERESLKAQLMKEIPRLPERQRTILGLYYFENLTLKEIGEVIGVSDARISQILSQVMLTLRGRLMVTRSAVLS